MTCHQIPLITCRKIEAGLAGPLIEAFTAALPPGKAREIATSVIASQAAEAGSQAAASIQGNSLEHLWQVVTTLWARDGALEIKLLKLDSRHLDFNVTRCAYVDMYRRLGLAHMGQILSCSRDGAFARGFNPAISMQRSRTIMAGDRFCDFRFSLTCQPE